MHKLLAFNINQITFQNINLSMGDLQETKLTPNVKNVEWFLQQFVLI